MKFETGTGISVLKTPFRAPIVGTLQLQVGDVRTSESCPMPTVRGDNDTRNAYEVLHVITIGRDVVVFVVGVGR